MGMDYPHSVDKQEELMADQLHRGPLRAPAGPFAITVDGHVADVSIDHPPSNIFDDQFTVALRDLLDRCEADPDVRVLLFHSADPDFFVMHGDARSSLAMQVAPGTEVAAPDPYAAQAALLERVHRSRLVSIAAIDGAARGGGAELVSALDLRIGGPRTVFGFLEVAMGLLPGWGGPARLPHLLGRSRALDVILTCRDVGAEEALAMAWLDRLVPSDRVLVEAGRVARRIGAMPGESIAAVKAVVDTSLGGIGDALVAESTMMTRLLAAGGYRRRIERFLAAGGQERDAERDGFEGLVQAMIDDREGP
jgi:enoyl-CoA hydratase/carnithine racemase